MAKITSLATSPGAGVSHSRSVTIISERYPDLKAQELYQNLRYSSKEVKIELPLREEDILKH